MVGEETVIREWFSFVLWFAHRFSHLPFFLSIFLPPQFGRGGYPEMGLAQEGFFFIDSYFWFIFFVKKKLGYFYGNWSFENCAASIQTFTTLIFDKLLE